MCSPLSSPCKQSKQPLQPEQGGRTPGDKAALVVIEDSTNERDTPSLQNAFLLFKERRKAQLKEAGKLKRQAEKKRNNPRFKTELRRLFLEAARGYLGVPYARRFHDPEWCTCEGCEEKGEQLYHEPLFLDCCALVRRCVADLKEQFGFKLGGGNQSYQFDTLPVRVDSINKLKPGDLIFYEGKYYNPAAKRPKHDMVHVEIFTGSGEKGEGTIGSREQKKWVKEYDDYRIEKSPRWKLVSYHFVKIDTWLEGTCKSFCPVHLWPVTTARRKTATKSVFALSSSEDEAADGDDCCAP